MSLVYIATRSSISITNKMVRYVDKAVDVVEDASTAHIPSIISIVTASIRDLAIYEASNPRYPFIKGLADVSMSKPYSML
ncbi:MAG: hypothetical protein QXG81_07920 [Ignisphaera sp.]